MKKMNRAVISLMLLLFLCGITYTGANAGSKAVIGKKVKLECGESLKASKVLKKSGIKFTSKKTTYKTENKKIVSVNKKGVIRAKKVGEAKVVIKYKNKTQAVLKINVIAREYVVPVPISWWQYNAIYGPAAAQTAVPATYWALDIQ